MEGMRELLQGSLGRTLEAMTEEDRLAAAWPVACGKALSERGRVMGYEDGVVIGRSEGRGVAATDDERA